MVTTNRVMDASLRINIISDVQVTRMVNSGDIIHTSTVVYDGNMVSRGFMPASMGTRYTFTDHRHREAYKPLPEALTSQITPR